LGHEPCDPKLTIEEGLAAAEGLIKEKHI